MNLLRAISDFARRLNGTRRCSSVADLARYIKKGDVQHLAYWISQVVVYTKDRLPSQEWKDADTTVREEEGDCEDMALVAYRVMATWGTEWTPRLLWLERVDKTNAGRVPKAHAVLAYETPDLTRGVIDNGALYEFKQEKKVAWAWIFSHIPGNWEKAFWVDTKGKKLHMVGWERA